MTQIKARNKKDWSSQVFSDLKELEMGDSLEEIKCFKKLKLKSILSKKIKKKVFEDLNRQKENHSKVNKLIHNSFEMQKYFKPCQIKITKEEAQEILKLRSRMSNVKVNYKQKYETHECDMCDENEDESQEHLICCKIPNINNQEILKYEDLFDGNVYKKVAIARKN